MFARPDEFPTGGPRVDVESGRLFQLLVESVRDYAIFVLDPEGRIASWNEGAKRIKGYRREEVLGKHFRIFYPEQDRERGHPEEVLQCARKRGRHAEDGWRVRKDGARFWASVVITALHDGDRLIGYAKVVRDLTEKKEFEDAQQFLAEASWTLASSLDYEEGLHRLAELAVPNLADFCIIDIREGEGFRRVASVHADPAMEAIAREVETYPPDPHGGHPVLRVMRTGKPEIIRPVSSSSRAAIAQAPRHRELIDRLDPRYAMLVPLIARGRALGAILFIATSEERVYNEGTLRIARELANRAAVAVDNARLYKEARDASSEAERRREALERLSESRARLMRGFSHDVKNPLGAADSNAQLLELGVVGDLSAAQRTVLGRMRRLIHASLELIDDLTELARAEAGRLPIEQQPVDLREVIGDVVESYRAQADDKGLDLHAHLPAELPEIRTDPKRVRQIVGNLVSNALKYTDEGRIDVRTAERADGGAPAPGRWITVVVADTGRGIPKDEQGAVFEEFVRIRPGEMYGAGLGLAISQRIARALGGEITLDSEVGRGSIFTLWLPVRSVGPAEDRRAEVDG